MYRYAACLLVFGLGAALAAPQIQYAEIKAARAQRQGVQLTLNYIDLVLLGTPAADRKAMQLGNYKTTDELYDANPSGIYTRDVNPRLRTLTTSPTTVFELVCLPKTGGLIQVSPQQFMNALKGARVTNCSWDFGGGVVRLELDGPRVLKVSQQYFP